MLATMDRKEIFDDSLWEPQDEMSRQKRHAYGCFSFLEEHFGHIELPSRLAQRVVVLRGAFLSHITTDMQADEFGARMTEKEISTFKDLSELIHSAIEFVMTDEMAFRSQAQPLIEFADRIMAAMDLYMEDILESVEADEEVDYRQALKVDSISESDIAKIIFDLLMETSTPEINKRAVATVVPKELRRYVKEAHGFASEIGKLHKGLTIFDSASLATFLVLPFLIPGGLHLLEQVTYRVIIALFALAAWGVLVKRPPNKDWWKAIKVSEYARLAVDYAAGTEPWKIGLNGVELRKILFENQLFISGIPTVIELHNRELDEERKLTRVRLVQLLNTHAAIMRKVGGLSERLQMVRQRERYHTIPMARNATVPTGVVRH